MWAAVRRVVMEVFFPYQGLPRYTSLLACSTFSQKYSGAWEKSIYQEKKNSEN